ncbi:WASH complex subunit 2-like [Adelges cooleyi]|uniref:WASH complex subunit 2-like n=1 Tax=Adelges cooleyi TaxID=133065 RepID=UPI00217F241C|nr:WASH complex subunit 2-like [Adelges cooleyi]
MDDKVQSVDSHVWTLGDFIERRNNWNQLDEVQLAKYLEQLSKKIAQGAKSTLNDLDDLVACVDDTAVKVANINNEFQLLADKQFIENKVQEEDETVQKLPEKSVENKFDGADTLVDDLKTAVKNSFNVIETHFDKVTVVISDSDDDDLKHEETILRPRHFYKKLRLPTITGSVQPEEIETNNMSSDSESYVKQSSKNEESLSSSDAEIVDDIQSISKDIPINQPYNENAQKVNSQNISYEPKTPVSIPQTTDNDNEDIFSPPPLSYDNDDEDDNEYNMFGPSTNDMYGEQNLWEDDYENDYSNEPPLPVCPDDLPKPIPQPNVEEKSIISDVQQSLNDELRKRFNKEDISSREDINESQSELPRKKIPKGAVNILGGPSNSVVRHIDNLSSIIEPPKETLSKDTTKSNQAADNHEKMISNNLTEDKKLPVINKVSKTKKVRSFFDVDTDSDEENFFAKKANVTSGKPVNSKKIETSEDVRNVVGIFSESDPDEDLPISQPSKKNVASSHTIKLLDSSSDDDLFNVKPSKSKSALTLSNNTDKNVFENSKAKAHGELKSSSEHNRTEKKIIDNNKDCRVNSSPIVLDNNSVLNNEVKSSDAESVKPQISNTISTTTKEKKTSSFLFSSDEEDALFNVNKSTKIIDGNNVLPSQSHTVNITSNVLSNVRNESKLDLFDSSSDDDDLFNMSKSKKKTPLPEKTQSENTANIHINDNNVNNKFEYTEIIDDNSDKIERYSVSNSIFSENQDLLSNNSISSSPTTPVMIKSNMNSSSDEFFSPVLRIEKNSEEKELPQQISVDLLNDIECVLTERDKNDQREQPMATEPNDNNVSWVPDSDGKQYSTPKFDSNIKSSENVEKTTETDFVPISNADYKDSSNSDSPDGSSMSSQKLKDESSVKLPGKLHKNAGAFINVASLLPNSKKPSKLSNVSSNTEESTRENDLPSNEAKLFSAGKDRAKIQVKRRPQSRKARQAAARMSAVEYSYEQNLQVQSRMFGSASDLVDYHYSPALLDDDNSDLKNNQNKIKVVISDNKIESNDESVSDVKDDKQEVASNSDLVKLSEDNCKQFYLNLSDGDDDDDDIFESKKKLSISHDCQVEKTFKFDQSETSRREADDSDSKLYATNTINNTASTLFVADDDDSDDLFGLPKTQHTNNNKNESETESKVQQVEPKTYSEETPKNEVSSVISDDENDDIVNTDKTNKQSEIIQEEKIEKLDVKKSETKSTTKKYDLLLSADDDDDNIFLSKSKIVKPTTSNLFDSDDDLDFDQKAPGKSKKDLAKSKSLFGDDSDDDLFTNKTTTPSKFTSKKPTEQVKNLPSRAGVVKLTAESVADNPLL